MLARPCVCSVFPRDPALNSSRAAGCSADRPLGGLEGGFLPLWLCCPSSALPAPLLTGGTCVFLPQICKGTPQHEEICLGLFTLVLTEPAQAQKVRPAPVGKHGKFVLERFLLSRQPAARSCGSFGSRAGVGRRLGGTLGAEQCLL